jgi:hypothetical protein
MKVTISIECETYEADSILTCAELICESGDGLNREVSEYYKFVHYLLDILMDFLPDPLHAGLDRDYQEIFARVFREFRPDWTPGE